MTGPEHYREAERLIERAGPMPAGEFREDTLALAAVHAQLATASAAVLGAANGCTTPSALAEQLTAWREVGAVG